jgi:hypothetical protein
MYTDQIAKFLDIQGVEYFPCTQNAMEIMRALELGCVVLLTTGFHARIIYRYEVHNQKIKRLLRSSYTVTHIDLYLHNPLGQGQDGQEVIDARSLFTDQLQWPAHPDGSESTQCLAIAPHIWPPEES